MALSTSGSTSGGTAGDVSGDVPADGIEHERRYVAMLYERLDRRRAETARRLEEVLHDETVGTPQALTERDVAAGIYTDRLAALRAAEHGLAFGRLDTEDGEVRYVGRLGLLDEDDEYNSLLMDWRAPAARPFYTATAASPEGIRRRRHLRTRRRTVTGIDDEILDLDAARAAGAAQASGLTSEAALLAAVGASRTGRMADIVATIQAEQDEIIRSKPSGVLVVQGGPGTGKTAVALHRAAYLLYTHRDRLARRGVLVIGPNPTFLRYIGQVLPSLGETSVVLSTVGQLFPGLDARRAEPPEVAEVKGRAEMTGSSPRRCATGSSCRGGLCGWSSSSRRCGSTATSWPQPAPAPAAPAGRTTPPSGSSTRRRSGCWPSRSRARSCPVGGGCSTRATSPRSATS